MKTGSILLTLTSLALLAGVHQTAAQSTAFTYQGSLQENGVPFSGAAELQFTLWNAPSSGTQVAATTPTSVIVSVSNGLVAASVDFGGSAFNGQGRWLQIDLRTTIGPFTTLAPRQPLTAAPYALYSANASMAGTLSAPISDSLLSPNIARLRSSPTFTGTVAAASFAGNGSALTGISHLDSPGGGPSGALTVDSLGRVAVGTNNSGAALQVAGGGLSAFGGAGRGMTIIKGNVVCAGCSLEEARKAQPNEHQLYEFMHQRGQVVMKVSSVNDSQMWGRFIWPPWIWVRAQDRVFQQLAAEENLFKEVEIAGLLNNSRTLDIFKVTIHG